MLITTTAAIAATALSVCSSGCIGLHVNSVIVHSTADWPMSGRTASGMFSDTSAQIAMPPVLLWKYELSGGTGPASAIVADSVLFCSTLLGEISGIAMANGKEIGTKKFSAPVAGAMLSMGNDLYVCTEAGKATVYDYNLRSGEVAWKKNIGGIASSPIAVHATIVVGTLDGWVFALRPSDGEALWKYKCGAPIFSTPCADDSLLYCADTDGCVYALRAASGTLVWKYRTGGAVFGGLSVVRDIVYAGSRDHQLYALDARTGTLRWTHDCGDRIMASVACNDSLVVVGALNGSVAVLTHNGGLRWKFSAQSAVNVPAVIIRDMVFVASLDTFIYALSLADGSVRWKESIDARCKTAPIVWNGSLILIGDNRFVYRFGSR